jgi:iron(III) transport system substrate-binding protein
MKCINKVIRYSMPIILALQFAGDAWAQAKKPVLVAELASYTSADREQRLIAGAKAEAKVVWYTSLAGSSYKELAKRFETKYGIKMEPYRATSTDIIPRSRPRRRPSRSSLT